MSEASVLVVDDTPDNLRLLLRVLIEHSYDVRPALNGAAAIVAAQLDPPDLILLDIKMPVMDGYEVCKRLKADARTRDIPVIFLTVLDDVIDVVRGFELGGVDYVTKPVRTGELLARIENQVQRQQLQKQLSEQNETLQQLLLQYQASERALKESEKKFSIAFEKSPLPLSLTSIPDGRYIAVNRAYVRHTEYSREALIGKRPRQFGFWIDLASRKRFLELVRTKGRVEGYETRLRTRTGRLCEVILFAEVLKLEGKPRALIAAQDITLRKEDERKLSAKTQELSEALKTLQETQGQLIQSAKMAALGNLVAGVAHEINTPVGTAITTASTLENATRAIAADIASGNLKRSSFDSYLDVATECSQLILSNLFTAGELVQSFKQVAVDQSSLQSRMFALKLYLQEVITNLTPTLKQTPHRIVLNGSSTITLHSYPGAIAQIITNLIINSLTHAYPEGHRPGTIRLTLHEHPGQVIMQYTDDGCGILPEYQSRVFEPFFTTARELGGSGLGLHLVYNLVTQKLRGTINIASTPGSGTTFTITLPSCLPESSI